MISGEQQRKISQSNDLQHDASMQADYAADLPLIVRMSPNYYKPARVGRCIRGILVVEKFVKPDFYRSVIRYWIHFYTTRHQFTPDFSADITLRSIDHLFFRVRKTAFVMIKFKIFCIVTCIQVKLF